MSVDARAREAAAMRVLAEAGMPATVRSAGQDGEIAALTLPAECLHDAAAQAHAIRALGFRYVAVDIGPVQRAERASG